MFTLIKGAVDTSKTKEGSVTYTYGGSSVKPYLFKKTLKIKVNNI